MLSRSKKIIVNEMLSNLKDLKPGVTKTCSFSNKTMHRAAFHLGIKSPSEITCRKSWCFSGCGVDVLNIEFLMEGREVMKIHSFHGDRCNAEANYVRIFGKEYEMDLGLN